LSIAGERGVQAVIQNLIADFDLTLGLAGCTSVAEVTAERLAT
jgi:lactate 2-monooxygenase